MLKLAEIMTPDVVTVTPETPLRYVVELFMVKHISGAPVVNGRDVVGVISAADLLGFAASLPSTASVAADAKGWDETPPDEAFERDEPAPATFYTGLLSDGTTDVVAGMDANIGRTQNEFDEYIVDDVMTHEPITLSPNDTVVAAAEVMQRRAIHRVLVVDDGKLVGIVSALDVARAVAEHKLTTRTYVFNDDRDFEERVQGE